MLEKESIMFGWYRLKIWAMWWDYGTFHPPQTHSSNVHAHPSSGARCLIFGRTLRLLHTPCVRTAKALARLCICAGSPEPSLVAHVISTIISWAGSFHVSGLLLGKPCDAKLPNSYFHDGIFNLHLTSIIDSYNLNAVKQIFLSRQNVRMSWQRLACDEVWRHSWSLICIYRQLSLTRLCITRYYHIRRSDSPVPTFFPIYLLQFDYA